MNYNIHELQIAVIEIIQINLKASLPFIPYLSPLAFPGIPSHCTMFNNWIKAVLITYITAPLGRHWDNT